MIVSIGEHYSGDHTTTLRLIEYVTLHNIVLQCTVYRGTLPSSEKEDKHHQRLPPSPMSNNDVIIMYNTYYASGQGPAAWTQQGGANGWMARAEDEWVRREKGSFLQVGVHVVLKPVFPLCPTLVLFPFVLFLLAC